MFCISWKLFSNWSTPNFCLFGANDNDKQLSNKILQPLSKKSQLNFIQQHNASHIVEQKIIHTTPIDQNKNLEKNSYSADNIDSEEENKETITKDIAESTFDTIPMLESTKNELLPINILLFLQKFLSVGHYRAIIKNFLGKELFNNFLQIQDLNIYDEKVSNFYFANQKKILKVFLFCQDHSFLGYRQLSSSDSILVIIFIYLRLLSTGIDQLKKDSQDIEENLRMFYKYPGKKKAQTFLKKFVKGFSGSNQELIKTDLNFWKALYFQMKFVVENESQQNCAAFRENFESFYCDLSKPAQFMVRELLRISPPTDKILHKHFNMIIDEQSKRFNGNISLPVCGVALLALVLWIWRQMSL